MQKIADEDIRKTTQADRDVAGVAPRAWLGPALTETWDTPERLVDAGHDHLCDGVLDDQPLDPRSANGSVVNVPYTRECSDVAMMVIQHHPARENRDRATDQTEQLLHDARGSARVMALVLHPCIIGAPPPLPALPRGDRPSGPPRGCHVPRRRRDLRLSQGTRSMTPRNARARGRRTAGGHDRPGRRAGRQGSRPS